MMRIPLLYSIKCLFIIAAYTPALGQQFAPAVNYNAGTYPTSVFSADFDGDNDFDLAVANMGSDSVLILYNNSDGTFQAPIGYGAGDAPYSVFSADFDGDSDFDLAVANYGSDNVSILRNNGDGTFQTAVNYGTGASPHSVFSADFDGNNYFDIAVTNEGSESVSILLNSGDGTFQPAVNYIAGVYPTSVFSADFDADGDFDLAVANIGSDSVSILLNSGDGTFQPAVNYIAGVYPTSVFSADFDADGDLDLAVGLEDPSYVSILSNNGDGTFQEGVNYGVGDFPWSVYSTDFDRDSDFDLAVANWHSHNVSILSNNGDGTFQPGVNYATGNGAFSVFSADFDLDGRFDLAVANPLSDNISILINTTVRVWHISTTGNDTTGDGSQQNPFRTIQHGIDVASDGDTVLVQPGTYFENLLFGGHRIALTSLYLTTGDTSYISNTIIDGSNQVNHVIKFNNGEDNSTQVIGFTLQNGYANYGGGINCDYSSPTIRMNIIKSNIADYGGGGIYCLGSTTAIVNNKIVENTVLEYGYGHHAGAGILLNNCSTNIVEGNLINGNIAVNGAGGGFLAYNSFGCIVKRNIFLGNFCGGAGGGIFLTYGGSTQIINNSIYNNEDTLSGRGAGIDLLAGDNYIIKNNVIAGNIGIGIAGAYLTSPVIEYNDVWGNSQDYEGVSPGIGSISLDPLFVGGDPIDLHLTGNSPCIDAGDPSSPYDPDSTIADIGAYFFDQSYRILNFSLIAPNDSFFVLSSTPTFTWYYTEDTDSGYVVSYNLIWDEDPAFGSPDSTGTQPDTVYTLLDSLNRSTRYYWRVLASNGHAVPIYSDETWSFYIDGYPTRPNPYTPENGANADSVTIFTWYVGTDPDTFDAVSYTIQIDDDSLFASPEIDQSGLSNTLLDEAFAIQLGQLQGVENLQMDTKYYWRVRSDDNYGLSSPWPDSLLYFTYLHQNHPPYPPDSGFSPANGEEIISLIPTVTWNDATDPDPDDISDSLYYDFYLFEDTSTGGQEYRDTTDQGINQITVTDTLHDNAHFYYQVRTIDDEGLASSWSTLQNFWTNHYNYPPEPFPLYSPDPDHTRVVMNTDFVWGNTVDLDPMSSFAFTLEYSPDSMFVGSVSSVEAFSDTSLTIATDSLMLAGQDLYWRILAIDDDSLARVGGIPEEVRYLRILPPGDANSSGQTNGLDVTYLVNYLKGQGPAPDPLLAGDANGDCTTNGLDVIYLVAYFKGGSAPVRPDCDENRLLNDKLKGDY